MALAMAAGVMAGALPLHWADAAALEAELRDLLETHPRIRAERNRVESAHQQSRSAFADFLPRLAVSGDAGPEYVDTPIRSEAGTMSRNKATATATQKVFDGFRTLEGHRAANLREDVARYRLDATRQSLMLEGITAYYDVLRQARLIAIAQRSETAIRNQLNLEDERVRRGGGIAVDTLFAKARLQLALERTVQLRGALAEAQSRYLQVFGRPAVVAQMNDPALSLRALPGRLDDAAAISADSNPALRASQGETLVADKVVETTRADFYPQFDLVGTANREDDVDAVRGIRRDWSVLLTAKWDLFSGFRRGANTAAAAEDKAAAQNTYLHNRRKVDEELRIAWHQLETARRRVDLLDNAAAIAEEVFEARKRLREAGRETAINVLDAETEALNAQINLTAARFDVQVATFRVLFSMGQLTPENLGF
jgi:adhesin transport system outer membrane protein